MNHLFHPKVRIKARKEAEATALSKSAVSARHASEVDHDSPDVGHMSQTSAIYMEARRLVHREAKAGQILPQFGSSAVLNGVGLAACHRCWILVNEL